MRKINKGVIYGFVFGFIAFVGITYASQSITNINQTAVTGDRITAAWVNDVNSKIKNSNIQYIQYNCHRNTNYENCSGLQTIRTGPYVYLTTISNHSFCTLGYAHNGLNQWLGIFGSQDQYGKAKHRLTLGWGAFHEAHNVSLNCYDF